MGRHIDTNSWWPPPVAKAAVAAIEKWKCVARPDEKGFKEAINIAVVLVGVELLEDDDDRIIRLVACRPERESEADLDIIDDKVRFYHSLSPDECIYFFKVERGDASDFEKKLMVTGERVGKHRVLRAKSPVVANAFAALLIDLENRTGKVPHAYFKWHEGNPIVNLFAFLLFGEGDAAPLTHEVLRRAVKDAERRPVVHVS